MFTDHSQGQPEQLIMSLEMSLTVLAALSWAWLNYFHAFSFLNRPWNNCIRSKTNWNWENYVNITVPGSPKLSIQAPGSAASPRPWWCEKKQSSKGAAGLLKNKQLMTFSCYREIKGQRILLDPQRDCFQLVFSQFSAIPWALPSILTIKSTFVLW